MRREMGDRNSTAHSLIDLGHVVLRQGDDAEALASLQEGLTLFRALANRSGIARALETFAVFAEAQERGARAAQLLGAAEALREATGEPLSPKEQETHRRQACRLRELLEEGFAAAWAEGRAMTMERAVRIALEEDMIRLPRPDAR
jgi:hypothetical protein